MKRTFLQKLSARVFTITQLVAHFSHRERFFLAPLLLVLLVASILLVATGGLGVIAPFVYTLF